MSITKEVLEIEETLGNKIKNILLFLDSELPLQASLSLVASGDILFISNRPFADGIVNSCVANCCAIALGATLPHNYNPGFITGYSKVIFELDWMEFDATEVPYDIKLGEYEW